MHIPLETLAVGCAIASTATAFYPYHRPDGSSSSSSKARRVIAPQPLSNPNNEPRRSFTLPLRRVASSLRLRENKYDIANSDDPKPKNSVAVDQDKDDLTYMVAVTIGDSKEEYHLLLDSASSNTWVMSEDCTTDACNKHNTFGKGDSKTLKTNPKTFAVTYGTGSVSGTTATDTIHIGTSASSLSANLTFGLATNVSDTFTSYPMEGLFGMGRGTKADSEPQLVQVLASSKQIASRLYGLHLSRQKDGKNDGELNLGEVNKDRFDGDLNWISTQQSERGFWEIPLSDAGFGGKTIGAKNKIAIIDTGTSFFFLPLPEAAALHKLIDGSTQDNEDFQVPCSTTQPITLTFGSQTYNMSTADWMGGKADSGLCYSKIVGRQTFGKDEWLVGDAFLKNVYTAFDFENNRIGFGVKGAGSGNNSNSTGDNNSTSTKPSGNPSGGMPPPSSTSGSGSPPSGSPNASAAAPTHRVIPASAFALTVALSFLAVFV